MMRLGTDGHYKTLVTMQVRDGGNSGKQVAAVMKRIGGLQGYTGRELTGRGAAMKTQEVTVINSTVLSVWFFCVKSETAW